MLESQSLSIYFDWLFMDCLTILKFTTERSLKMNIYKKFCPNVFIGVCDSEHKKGDLITVTTKYGKENEHIVHNLVFKKDGLFYYSITRADGFNSQERAKMKAERLQNAACNAESKSNSYYERSHSAVEHIPMGQPILVGHHSEARHRRDLEKSWSSMSKSVEMSKKAQEYESRAAYWEKMSGKIDLSMPECIDFYEYELEKAVSIPLWYD